MDEVRKGTLLGAGAYAVWGLLPLYWPLLEPSGSLEVLSHRVVWSLLVVGVLVWALHRWPEVRDVLRDRRRVGRLAVAAVLIAVNWGAYIYGVSSEQVVETSLGYFINPLVTVLLGVLVLGERLRPVQWFALGLAALAVVVLTVEAGRPPLLALLLAGTFGLYGLLKKTAGVRAVEGLAVETAVLVPIAAGYLLVLAARGTGTFTSAGTGHLLLVLSAGLVTVVPLLMFGAAAQRVTMTNLGLLQYLAPTMQLLLGVLVRHEPLGMAKLLGFALVWVALAVFTYDLVHTARSRPVPELV
ncbi:MAG TPA: EamA family transporter RarD [Mycobacteriales bacterium]|nr:EamA family transporter RarD [Mycobacteriales bacterium]